VKIIELKARKQAKKFGYMEHTYTAKLKDVRSNKAHVNVLPEVFKELETYLKKAVLYEDGDKFDIIIDNLNFFTPLSTGYHWETSCFETLAEYIGNIVTSDQMRPLI